MILWDGACMVHEVFSVNDLLKLKRRNPDARTIAHPECPANIREHSDFIGGTEAMIRHVEGLEGPSTFLVATEANMLWQLRHAVPRHTLPASAGDHLRLQQLPAHGPQHPGEAAGLPARRPAGDPLAARVRPGLRGPPQEPARLRVCSRRSLIRDSGFRIPEGIGNPGEFRRSDLRNLESEIANPAFWNSL